MSNNKENKKSGLEQYIVGVSIVGLFGLAISVYLLLDYKEPLLNIWKLVLNSIFG